MLLTTPQNTTDIASIVSRARSLRERLFSASSTTISSKNEAKIEERLQRWCQVVAQGDFTKFEQRLTWSGLDINQIRPLLTDSNEEIPQPLPEWANTLERVIKKAQTLSLEQIIAPQSYFDIEEPIPFEHIYLPCLRIAKDRLLNRIGDRSNLFAKSSQSLLERQLLLQLANVSTATLMSEFSAFRSSGNTTRDFLLFNIINCNHQKKYCSFIQKLFQDGLYSLFEKYSVLGKLVATTIDLWVDTTAEAIARLAKDWYDIEQNFSPERALKQVVEIKTGLSDPHNGRRTVAIITFDTGLKLVYKPKDLAIEAVFYQFLAWFNRQESCFDFKILQVLNYTTHGWVEYVATLPCKNQAEARRFYRRSGMLLCLIHLLEGTDCHSENLIASGEHHVSIDTETLLHPHDRISESTGITKAQVLAGRNLAESPLRTFMLPQWGITGHDNLDVDLSGLGKQEEQIASILRWKNINTDGMKLEENTITLAETKISKPVKTALTSDNYWAEVIAGFEQMYGFLSDRQEILLAPNSPLTNLANLKTRYVFRATRVYVGILNQSFTPDLLKSGIDRSIGLDILSRAFLSSDRKPAFWGILEAELQAMENLDVPFLTVNTSQPRLKLPTGLVISDLFAESSFARVISRFKSLSKMDLNRQLETIRASFCSRFAQKPDLTSSLNRKHLADLPECNLLTSEQLVREAVAIAKNLEKKAISADDGSLTWIGLTSRTNARGFQLQVLNNTLDDGCSGVALFLAALAKVTGDFHWQDLALRTLQPIRYLLQDSSPQAIGKLQRLGVGGANGLGSMVYALAQIAHLIQDRELIEDAQKIANLITPDLISADRSFNLLNGTAGTILGCLKLHQIEQLNLSTKSNAIAIAIACGEHLLKYQTLKTNSDKLSVGFDLGLAGIAHALLQLFALTQDSRFLARAEKAIAQEQNYFSTTEQLNRDLDWTNFAAGIGLGRLGSLSILDNETIRQDIESALKTTQKFCLEDIDNLAWGNFGRIETLLIASQQLNRSDLFDLGIQATTHLVKQAQMRGRFNLNSPSLPAIDNPSFFQGITGIGYQLLRIAYPDLLPSILLMV